MREGGSERGSEGGGREGGSACARARERARARGGSSLTMPVVMTTVAARVCFVIANSEQRNIL